MKGIEGKLPASVNHNGRYTFSREQSKARFKYLASMAIEIKIMSHKMM
jgi:hypothetical protein